MKKILLFGAGKSATVLIEYLLEQCRLHSWIVIVADANPELIAQKLGTHSSGRPLPFDINNQKLRQQAINEADAVISLLPPHLHILVARDCLTEGKHLLTASYIDEAMEALRPEVEKKGLLFLCEMGLDPGIDHMSLKKMIDDIHANGGKIQTVRSHCGGLVAPQSDNSPWHYKISWNPRNVVHAGKSGAKFLKDGAEVERNYRNIFSTEYRTTIRNVTYCWYANRNSLPYLKIYNLSGCKNFVRTTLRHPHFVLGWSNLISMGCTSDEDFYETDGLSLAQFFKEIVRRNDLETWMKNVTEQSRKGQATLSKPEKFDQVYQGLKQEYEDAFTGLTDVSEDAHLEKVQPKIPSLTEYDDYSLNQDVNLFKTQLAWLGFNDDQTLINKGRCSAADVLQFALEKNLALVPGDRDMVVMCHEIKFEQDGRLLNATSSMVLEGEDDVHTAMATTVGLPLGIATTMLLKGELTEKGLLIPTTPQIYEPVLQALKKAGIYFEETVESVKS